LTSDIFIDVDCWRTRWMARRSHVRGEEHRHRIRDV
jgi:hypothetical protein